MILIPEIKTIVLLVPRTGTRALKRAVEKRYPNSFALYRHMEADGVPHGYDRWQKVGVVRDPVARLWSLYKYLQRFGLDFCEEHDDTYTASMRASVQRPFEDWMMHNELVFTAPYDRSGAERFWPFYCVNHPLPENRKSQFVYLRPDLGTHVFKFSEIERLHALLDVEPLRINGTEFSLSPRLSSAAYDYAKRWFAWDFQATSTRPNCESFANERPL